MPRNLKFEKLQLLYGFSQTLPSDPVYMFAVGLLAGLIHRVHFVRDAKGAPVSVKLVSSQSLIWPAPGFSAAVNGITVPEPMTLASVLAKDDSPICVELVHPSVTQDEDIQHLFVDSFVDVEAMDEETVSYSEKRTTELRQQIDHALDIYNECQTQLQRDDGSRQQELQAFLEIAKGNLSQCSRELKELESQLE